MNIKKKVSDIFVFLTKYRNKAFLYMCLGVHISYMISFFLLGLIPIAVINAISILIYLLLIFASKNRESSEKSVVISYFEIIIFSLCCEIFTRGSYGFIYFVLGMIPVIFYQAPSYKNKRFLFQIFGILMALQIHHADFIVPDSFFSYTYELSVPYAQTFSFINLVITLFTIMYTSFFYEMELDNVKAEMNYNATHDALTGLFNRRYLHNELKNKQKDNISAAIIDIDNFKKINDTFGHDKGDEVLVKVASFVREHSAKNVIAVRWGGEEFTICCINTNLNDAYSILSDICCKISENTVLPDGRHVTVTAGLSDGAADSFEDVIKQADEYLYTGKQNGKNCIVWSENADKFERY